MTEAVTPPSRASSKNTQILPRCIVLAVAPITGPLLRLAWRNLRMIVTPSDADKDHAIVERIQRIIITIALILANRKTATAMKAHPACPGVLLNQTKSSRSVCIHEHSLICTTSDRLCLTRYKRRIAGLWNYFVDCSLWRRILTSTETFNIITSIHTRDTNNIETQTLM